jgi:hypothetical protein
MGLVYRLAAISKGGTAGSTYSSIIAEGALTRGTEAISYEHVPIIAERIRPNNSESINLRGFRSFEILRPKIFKCASKSWTLCSTLPELVRFFACWLLSLFVLFRISHCT